MKDFGYGLKKSSVINLDEADLDIVKELVEEEPSFNNCFFCGTCTATCSAGNFTDLNLRRIQLLIKRGQWEEAEENMKKCMLCGKCQWVCPKGVNTRHLILIINKKINARKIR